MRMIFFLMSMSCAVYLILGLFTISRTSVFSVRRKRVIDFVFSALCLMLALGTLGATFFVSSPGPEQASFWFVSFAWTYFCSPGLFFIFSVYLCRNEASPLLWAIGLLPGLLVAAVHYLWPASILSSVQPIRLGWHTIYNYASPWYWVNVANYSAFALGSIAVLVQTALTHRFKRIRLRASIVLASFIPTFLGTFITGFALRHVGIETMPPMMPLFLIFLVIGLAIALFRYDFLELNAQMAVDPILSSIYDAYVLVNAQAHILETNLGGLRHRGGLAALDLRGKPLSVLIPDAQDGLDWLRRNVSNSDRVIEADFAFEPGLVRTGAISVTSMESAEQGLLGYVVSVHDLSAEKKLEAEIERRLAAAEALSRMEEGFADAFRISPAGMLILERNTQMVLGVNEAFARIFRCSVRDLEDKDIRISGISILQESSEQVQELLNSGGIRNAREVRVQLESGAKLLLLVAASAFEFGEKSATLFSVLDITELDRLRCDLATVQKLESIGVLAGGIAHDFNNILTTIMGNVTLARLSAEEASEMDLALANAEAACLRARDLSHQLLTFSKGGEPRLESVDILRLLRESTRLSVSGSSVVPSFDAEPELPRTMADRSQLQQVISNIVLNAVQAMEGSGSLTIRVYTMTLRPGELTPDPGLLDITPGDYVVMSFADSGPGIVPELLPRIFDPYVTTKRSGSGLGLAICYSVMRRHHGTISVRSEPGKGATFMVYLPVVKTVDEEAELPAAAPRSGNGLVLVMDDEFAIRRTAERMLGRLGYSAVTCATGEQALERYREAAARGQSFCSIILDLTIAGGMGGLDTAHALRELDSSVPIFVSSGYSDDPVMASYRDYGFDGVLAKPYGIDELSRKLSGV